MGLKIAGYGLGSGDMQDSFSVVHSVITHESERPCQSLILLVDVSVTMSEYHWLVFKRRGVVLWHLKVGTRVQ